MHSRFLLNTATMDLLAFGNIYVVFLILLLVYAFYCYKTRPKNLPPGPIGLPIVGYLPFVSKPAQLTFDRLAKKYGPIFHMYLGGQLVIVLNDYAAIKEAFVKQAEVFSGRTHDANFFKNNEERAGISTVDGESWRQHRRFVISNLRDNGVGKLSLEPLLLNEIHCFLDELKKSCGKPTSLTKLLSMSLMNNIQILLTGNRYDYNDSRLHKTCGLITTLSQYSDPFALPTYLPWTTSIPKLKLFEKLEIRWQSNEGLIEISREMINNKDDQSNLQYESLTNAYLDKMQTETMQDKHSHFSMNSLLQASRDLLVAGTLTSAKTLLWGMIYLTNNPHVQSKVQDEIDSVIGRERDPSYNDHPRTPYTVATINEIHRIASLLPISLPHRATKDTKVMGYHIPKDAMIIPNMWAVHYDPKLWGDPHNFRPERFLGPDGQLNTPEYLIPFSIGKRACAGEPLAKMELYLYFTSFMQNFKLFSNDGCKLPVDSTSHLGRFPLFDLICFESRQRN